MPIQPYLLFEGRREDPIYRPALGAEGGAR